MTMNSRDSEPGMTVLARTKSNLRNKDMEGNSRGLIQGAVEIFAGEN